MLKIFKTIIIFFIILILSTSFVFATEIDMNLQNPADGNTSNVETSNTINNTGTDSTSPSDDTTMPDDDFEQDAIGGSVAPSGVSSIAQENMSFSNVLNILIITVGVILILLAIAILIRLKN